MNIVWVTAVSETNDLLMVRYETVETECVAYAHKLTSTLVVLVCHMEPNN